MDVNIQNLIDDARCYEAVRDLRWPERNCWAKFFQKQNVKFWACLGRKSIELFKDGVIFCLQMLSFSEHMVELNASQRSFS